MERTNRKYLYRLISFCILLVVWEVLTKYFPPLVVPRIKDVLTSLSTILISSKLRHMILITIVRLLKGLTIGILSGLVVGILMGKHKVVKGILMPFVTMIQTIPPVSWLVLALVWFGFNGKPSIFIVVTAALPITSIHVCNGIERISKPLLEMCEIYHFSSMKTLRHLIIPSIWPQLESAIQISIGIGWKICVMGEVLTVNDGIGGMIKDARLNMEPEMIIAWSIVVVLLFELSDAIFKKYAKKEEIPC